MPMLTVQPSQDWSMASDHPVSANKMKRIPCDIRAGGQRELTPRHCCVLNGFLVDPDQCINGSVPSSYATDNHQLDFANIPWRNAKGMKMSKIRAVLPILIAVSISQGAVAQGFNLGGILGGNAGNNGMAGIVAGTITGLMGQILQSLTAGEQQQRQQALQQAARGPSGSTTGWASADPGPGTSARPSASNKPAAATKKATYVNKGQVTDASGKKCSRIMETITMPDGQKGTSEELVCPS
jgi:hypothetical protein